MSANRILMALGCLLVLVMGNSPARGEEDGLDTTYIGSDTSIAFVAHPQRVFQRKSKHSDFRDAMLAEFSEGSAIDPKNLRQLVIQFGTDTMKADPHGRFSPEESATFVLRFDKPIVRDRILARGFRRNTKAMRKQTEYYRPSSESQPAVWFPDDRTMIVAKEWRLVKLIDQPRSMGLMVSRLRQADSSADLLVEVDAPKAAVMLKPLLTEIPDIEALSPLKLADQVTRATIVAKLTDDVPVRAQIRMNDDKSATQLKAGLDALLALAQAGWSKQRDIAKQNPPKEFKVAILSMIETVDTVLRGATSSVHGNQLHLRVEKKGGDVDMVTFMLGMFMVRSHAVEEEVRKVKVDLAVERALKDAAEKKIKAEEDARKRLERGKLQRKD